MCLLLPATFLRADGRVGMVWSSTSPSAWIIAPRPSMPPGEMIELVAFRRKAGRPTTLGMSGRSRTLCSEPIPRADGCGGDGFNNRLFTNQEERA